MRRYRKWVLTLGIVAAAPGVTQAGPFSWLSRDKGQPVASAEESNPNQNQKVADEIKKSLLAAKIRGSSIAIGVQGGVVTLTGYLTDPAEKQRATQLAARVPGVKQVDNRMIVSAPGEQPEGPSGHPPARTAGGEKQPAEAARAETVRHASAETNSRGNAVQVSAEAPAGLPQAGAERPASTSNQAMAQHIADSLQRARINGFDIQAHYQNGTARLIGVVSSPEDRTRAEHATWQVDGVQQVENHLQVRAGGPQDHDPRLQGHPAGPGMDEHSAHQYFLAQQHFLARQHYLAQQQMLGQQQMPGGHVHPVNFQPGGPGEPPGYPGHPGHPGGHPGMAPPAPPAYGYPGAAPPHTVYNQPQLPPYAWPAYAQYPNSAQVNYPTEYSASAWPYIGPFHSYPQIPLGWRKVQLEWDDGHWMLDFNGGKTDKWFWFMNPHNW